MQDLIYLTTGSGMVAARRQDGEWRETARMLEGRRLTCAVAWGDAIVAGAVDDLWVSHDRGESWRSAADSLPVRHVRWLGRNSTRPVRIFAGTEPAAIFTSDDGGDTWQPHPEVIHLRDQHGWYLPYSPEAGCVRGFAFLGNRGYAAVEQGGVLFTEDNGDSWRLVKGSSGKTSFHNPEGKLVHPDVHSIEVHPVSARRVLAATGGGLFYSFDGGNNWKHLYACYCRAAWIDPLDARHIIFAPADAVSRGGRIEQTRDGGKTWQPAGQGLDTPWPRHMVERFVQAGDELLAVLSNGQVYAAPLKSLDWRRILAGVEGVTAIAAPSGGY